MTALPIPYGTAGATAVAAPAPPAPLDDLTTASLRDRATVALLALDLADTMPAFEEATDLVVAVLADAMHELTLVHGCATLAQLKAIGFSDDTLTMFGQAAVARLGSGLR